MEYSKQEKILIWLSNFEHLQSAKVHACLEKFGNAENLYGAILNCDETIKKVFGSTFNDIFKNSDWDFIESFIKNLNSSEVYCTTIISKNYPSRLKQIYNPPINLYYKGDISLTEGRAIGIVGTRNPTSYGKTITYDFASNLAKAGLVVVSGLAMGVDKIAHQATLEAKGKTIAVLGSGFNYIYPAINKNLAFEIEKKGLLISEYPPQTTPQKFNFPLRNRIVAGLCEGVLLTEAGEKSGTLYTKEYAVEEGRNVYVVPGNVNSVMSKGTNNLIKNFQGICVLEFEDILKDMNIQPVSKQEVLQLTMEEELIYRIVEKEKTHFEEIANKTQIPSKNLNSYLTTMTIRGILKKLPGNYYSI
ncbi:MAG: DNA-processing protein DprA [Christensenellales bacterium]